MIKIATDTCSNMSFEEAEKLGVILIPQPIFFENETYLDGIDITREQFYEKLIKAKKLPTTSQPAPARFEELFKKVRDDGDELILVTISSGLSGTYNCAEMIKKQINYDGIHVVDSMHLVEGVKMLVLEAVKYRDTLSAEEIVAKLEELKPRLRVYAILDTLEYLHRGGRLSRSVALIGSLLNIKPICDMKNGNVTVAGRQRGIRRAVNFVVEKSMSDGIDWDYPVFFGYSYAKDNMKLLVNAMAKDPERAYNEAANLAPIVGVHIGPNAAYTVYVAEKK